MNAAIIVAGGTGDRTGLAGGKQLAALAGHAVLHHSLAAFAACPAIDAIVVVVHPDRVDEYRAAAVDTVGSPKVIAVAGGGETRQQSVARGLEAVPGSAEVIVIHDGARPMVTPDLIAEAVRALTSDPSLDGVVVGHPSYDTLKLVGPRDMISHTLDRATVWAAQTPQVFRAEAIRRAHSEAASTGYEGTDDASLVEHAGGAVRMVVGPRENLKVTVPDDLLVVERLLTARAKGERDG